MNREFPEIFNLPPHLSHPKADQEAEVMANNAAGSDQERALADRLETMPKYEAVFFSESLRRPLRIHLSEKF